MKTLNTQQSKSRKTSRKLYAALLTVLLFISLAPAKAQLVATIGTGTSQYSSSGTPLSPLGYYYSTGRSQYIYLASELLAAGFTAGNIHEIAFNVGSVGSAGAPNYTLSIGGTTLGGLTTTTGFVGGLTPVYTSTSGYPPSLGWNVINFSSTPYNWNGTDNIVIDVCYATYNTNVGGGSAGVYYNTLTNASLSSGASATVTYCGQPWSVISGSGSATTIRPNIRFYRLFPCSTAVKGTMVPSGVVSGLCPGTSMTIQDTGYTNALGMIYQWMSSPNATTWTAIGSGGNSPKYQTPPMISTVYYHLRSLCTNNGATDSSANVQFAFTAGFPVYASLPYYEGFENWGNGCAANDKLTSNNWTNFPNTGNASWRRDDSGASAAWTSPTTPTGGGTFKEGAHSARWHGYYAPTGSAGEGALSLYVDMSAVPGNKDLSFYYRFNYGSSGTYPGDSLNVDTSTDGGLTFGPLVQIGQASVSYGTWNKYTAYNVPINSAKTVFRFRAKDQYQYYDDVYLDAVKIVNPCSGKPTAGKVDTIIACLGQPFTLNSVNTSQAAGLSYQWQYRPPSSLFWANLPGGTVLNPSATMTGSMYYRLVVTCTNSGLSDTTVGYLANLAPFYYCYCSCNISPSYAPYGYVEVGNVMMQTQPVVGSPAVILNNGNPLPTTGNLTTNIAGYEDFRLTVPAPRLIRDSSYKLLLTQTSYYSSFLTGMYAAAWIDFDHDGQFSNNPFVGTVGGGERIMFKTIPSATNPTANQVFTIPHLSPVGLTGMRTTIQYYYSVYGINPCGLTYAYGQLEDYLVNIDYQPCSGPSNPGIALISDTTVCPGYTVDLIDTTYEKQHTNITRYWQFSTNGGASYAVIPSSMNTDILYNVVVSTAVSTRYRIMAICGPTGDTTYSNYVQVTSPSPVHCYPVSTSALGAVDSSDIGTVILGTFMNPAPGTPAGPHLSNPAATHRHSDFTNLPPVELYADSTYRIAVFQTMRSANHADALVSVFLDYNNNINYDVTAPPPPSPFVSELVYQGRTTSSNFFLDSKFTVPDAVIANKLTGMRVILNNDVSMVMTNPAMAGKGLFTSGEVEDYLVIFRRAGLSAGTPSLLQNVALYPNPTTDGKFTVLSDAARAVSHMDVVVTTITGQQIVTRSFDNVGTHFSTQLDLSTQAKGIYFVEIRADGEKITKKLIVR